MPDVNFSKDWTAAKIVLIYVLLGCVWVILTDHAISRIDRNKEEILLFQTYKGWLFVVATGALIYLLIRRGIERIRRSEFEKCEVGAKYSELIENANDIIYELDASGKFTSINRVGEQITGYARDEILTKTLAEILAPESQKYVHRLTGKALNEKRSAYEIEIIKKGGGRVLLEVSNHPLERDGELVGMQGIARDISERRAAQAKLAESENRTRELLETTNEGILVIDQYGVINFVNERMAQMLDYDPAEILDNYIFDFMDEESKTAAMKRLEAQRSGIKETFDFKFRAFDGGDLWTLVSAQPLFKNGAYGGAIIMVTDITTRKLAEESLKAEQKISNATIASLPGVFYFYTKDGKYLRWNENLELVSGYTSAEIAQMHPLELHPEEEAERFKAEVEEVFKKGKSALTGHLLLKDGTKKPYLFTGQRLKLDDEQYLLGVGIDLAYYESVEKTSA